MLLIDSVTYSSEYVPTLSDDNSTDNSEARICEHVTYRNAGDLAQIIAKSSDKTIKVRMNGSQHYDDMALSQQQNTSIKDAWELKLLLDTLNF